MARSLTDIELEQQLFAFQLMGEGLAIAILNYLPPLAQGQLLQVMDVDDLLESLKLLESIEYQVNRLSVNEIARALPDLTFNRQVLILLLLQKNKAISVFKQLQLREQARLIQEVDLPESVLPAYGTASKR